MSCSATVVFAQARQSFGFRLRNDRHLIFVASHHIGFGAHVIGDDHVAAFARQLGLSMGENIGRLRRKADDERRPRTLVPGHEGENIRIFDERKTAVPHPSLS